MGFVVVEAGAASSIERNGIELLRFICTGTDSMAKR